MIHAPRRSRSLGVTLVELLVVIGVLLILFALTIRTFQTMNSSKALDTETLRIASELNMARSLTLSSKDAAQFGLRLASSSVTLFQGASYDAASATNTTSRLNSFVRISQINLVGGGSNVVFQRLTGKTAQSGDVTLSLLSNASSSKTITIHATGLVEIR